MEKQDTEDKDSWFPKFDFEHAKKTLKNYRDSLKYNLSLIILVPTVLGGIWQLFELSSISISYIHFFSITQLVPDGLTILVFLFILFIQYSFFYRIIKEPEELAGYRHLYLENTNSKFKNFIVVLILLFATAIGTYYMYKYISRINNVNQFFMLLVWTNAALYFGVSIISSVFSRLKLFDKNTLTKFKFFFAIPFIYYSVMFTYHLVNYLQLPKDLANIKQIERSDITKGARVVYYNDKYVFIQEFDLLKFEKTGQYNLTNRVVSIEKLIAGKDSLIAVPKGYIYRVYKAFNTIDDREQIKRLSPYSVEHRLHPK